MASPEVSRGFTQAAGPGPAVCPAAPFPSAQLRHAREGQLPIGDGIISEPVVQNVVFPSSLQADRNL